MAVTMLAAALMLGGCGSSSSDPAKPSPPPAGDSSAPPAGDGSSSGGDASNDDSQPALTPAQKDAIAVDMGKKWIGTYEITDPSTKTTYTSDVALDLVRTSLGVVGGSAKSIHFEGPAIGLIGDQGKLELKVTSNGTWRLVLELSEDGTLLGITEIYSPNYGQSPVGAGSCTAAPPEPDDDGEIAPPPAPPAGDDDLEFISGVVNEFRRFNIQSDSFSRVDNDVSAALGEYRSSEDYDIVFKVGGKPFTAKVSRGEFTYLEDNQNGTFPPRTIVTSLVTVEAGQYIGDRLLTERYVGAFSNYNRSLEELSDSYDVNMVFAPESAGLIASMTGDLMFITGPDDTYLVEMFPGMLFTDGD
jgi:hypothetical protein